MIRTLDWMLRAEERSDSWLLVPQVEHAKLSGRLAEAWLGLDRSVTLASIRNDLVWAAFHHDDGWLEWDHAPKLDADGRPISFHEMHRDDSRPLWAQSIELAEAESSVAAILVAEHFVRLDSSSANDRSSDFSEHFADKIIEWRTRATDKASASDDAVSIALDHAVALLRLFDWMSLLICMGRLESPESLKFPDASEWQLESLSATRFRFAPWPFSDRPWTQTLNALRVPARAWKDAREMFASGERLAIQLEFTAAPDK